MKKLSIFLPLLMLAMSVFAQAPKQAQISNATVFLNGAQLTHSVVLPLQKGDNEVVIENLSPSINQRSLQVKIAGGVVISSYEYSIDYLSADKTDKSTKLLQDSLQQAQERLTALNSDLATTNSMLALLEKGVQHSLTVDGQNLSTETIEKNINYYQTRQKALQQQKASFDKSIADTKQLISRLQNQIRQDGKKQGARRSGLLRLNLNSPKTAQVKAEIQYFTPNASWQPAYELQVKKIGEPIDVVMKAHVSQTTGLDWQNVRLILSTGAPSSNNSAPELSTWFVRQYKPVYKETRRAKSYDANGAAMPMMMAMKATADEAVVADMAVEEEDAYESTISDYVTTNTQQLSVDYAIDLPYTILGNGKKQTIALLDKKIEDVTYTYYSAPKLDATSYLVAEVSNWERLQLLDGTAVVTYDGTFFGETYLSSSTTDQKLRLTLGDDKQVVVKREKVEDFTSTKVVGQDKRVSSGYKVTVRNNKQVAVNVVIKEQYPISTDKQIVCTLGDKTTPATEVDASEGLLTYNFELQPGEQKEIIVSYTIKYPKDWTLQM